MIRAIVTIKSQTILRPWCDEECPTPSYFSKFLFVHLNSFALVIHHQFHSWVMPTFHNHFSDSTKINFPPTKFTDTRPSTPTDLSTCRLSLIFGMSGMRSFRSMITLIAT